MSSAGRAVNSDGCVTKPKECGVGLRSCFVPIQSSSLTGSYVMATAEQWEPYESRGSRTVLGEPGGESPPGHSTFASLCPCAAHVRSTPISRHQQFGPVGPVRAKLGSDRGYSITSSARTRKDSGIVMPSAFAVLRLITSSNLVGFCTGRSPGLSPLRSLST